MTQHPPTTYLTLPVLSGSMMPYLCPGGRVRIECAATCSARPGDVVVFREADRLVAHRLLFRLRLGRHSYIFQMGDAAGIGYWIRERSVIGLVTESTAADGTLLYARDRGDRGDRAKMARLIVRSTAAWARSVLTQHPGGNTRRIPGEYRIGIGTITLGLRLVPRRYGAVLPQYFGRPGALEEPDIRLIIRVNRRGENAPLPDSLYYHKEIAPAGFALADRLVTGRRLRGGAAVELRVPRQLMCGHGIRVFEHLLHQAFSMAAVTRGLDCCLIHSAGVIRKGAGYLFVGASGSGKSTIAGLSRRHQVLNDEICMVTLEDGQPHVHGTPFNGFFREKVEGEAPLKAVFLLAQREEHRLVPVPLSEAVGAVFQQVVPPVALDEPVGKAAHERMLGAALRLLAVVPVYRLEFRKDDGFWRLIDGMRQKGNLA